MTRLSFRLIAVMLAFALCVSAARAAATTNEAPDFKEVYDLIRAHLEGVSTAELDQAAVQGLLAKLYPRVVLVTNELATKTESSEGLLSQSRVFDGGFAYLRVERVGEGLAKEISTAYDALSVTNRLKGLILDLRFAGGDSYSAAAAAADLFLAGSQPLLDWGNGMVESKTKTDAIKSPLAVLVNQQTSVAAEALAALLRATGVGLVIGNNTAGRATLGREYPLQNGQRLRIATSEIKLGNGTELSVEGVKPDIQVAVSAADEKVYFGDAYKVLSKPTNLLASATSSTNSAAGEPTRPGRRRLTEADLVRERREELNRDPETALLTARRVEPEKPMVRDPALARALDLLKGLVIVREFRSR